MEVLIKICSVILGIIGFFTAAFGFFETDRNSKDKEIDTPIRYYIYTHHCFVVLFSLLTGLLILEFSIMLWNNFYPYLPTIGLGIILQFFFEDRELTEGIFYTTIWENIKLKIIIAFIIVLIYQFYSFFTRKREFDKYLYKKATENKLEQLKRKDFIQYQKWEETIESIVENLDEGTYVYIKCKNGNVYRIGHNSLWGELIHKESSEDDVFWYEDSLKLEDIAHAIYRDNAKIIAITPKPIASLI